MRVVFAGTPEPALPALEAILDSGHEVLAVVTRPDAQSGRGRRVHPSPVAELAESRGVEVLKPAKAKDPEFLARLKELEPDCCPVVAYGALLPQQALDIPKHGWVNLHFSVLPAWRGAAPVQHAIRAGDDLTGATTFRIVKELDAGPVFGTLTEPIQPTDTAGDLLERLAEKGAKLLVDTLDGIEAGTLEAQPQASCDVTYASKVNVDDARIDWKVPAFAVDRLIRSCTPEPGAWTTFRGERLKLGPVRIMPGQRPEELEDPPLGRGTIRAEKHQVVVGTASVPVRLTQVQPHGKRPMSAEDWARGARPEPGEKLGVEPEGGDSPHESS
ncbi:methionyl-tRNA formyltransferase [Flindersiella endophytica]